MANLSKSSGLIERLRKCDKRNAIKMCCFVVDSPDWTVYFGLRQRPRHKECAWRNPMKCDSLVTLLVLNRNLLWPRRLCQRSLWLLLPIRLLRRHKWLWLSHLITWC
jgi:hypothetical protein